MKMTRCRTSDVGRLGVVGSGQPYGRWGRREVRWNDPRGRTMVYLSCERWPVAINATDSAIEGIAVS
jgi:hypothetical protein